MLARRQSARRTAAWLGGGALFAIAIALPVLGQESLLPPGFEDRPTRPAPAPAPTPAPRPTPPAAGSTPRPAAPASSPSPAPVSALPSPGTTSAATPATTPPTDEAEEDLPPAQPRYDMPPGSRRLLTRVGPLSGETGSLGASAFGNRGLYLTAIVNGIDAPILSRWGTILLRRTLLSASDTPPNVNGADFAAARALLLLRQGDAVAARMLVQSIDADKASARLRAAAMQIFVANGDPAGLCPFVPAMAGNGDDRWLAAQAMCSALVAEPGPANAALERLRRRGRLDPIDIKLAEKIVGAGINSRRSATVLWDDVETLTPWRLGLATATGVDIPPELWRTATPAMRGWAVQAPMIGVEQRVAWAGEAAAAGLLSSRGLVDLVSWAADREDAGEAAIDAGRELRLAFAAVRRDVRIRSILALGEGETLYRGRVLGARAAARVAPMELEEVQLTGMLQAMLAGGLDTNAMAWAGQVPVGSQAWGLLAVGSPRPLVGVDAGTVDDFAGSDTSADGLRTRFLVAALIGLARVEQDEAQEMAREHALGLGTSTRWTRGIREAASRREAGTVALLVATGLQGGSWDDVPPYHLYHIVRALREVGLGAEARMIAAEAMTRV